MLQERTNYHPKEYNEKIIVFHGKADPGCNLIIAGISYPNPNYYIANQLSDMFVFEYIIQGSGTVIHNGEAYHPKAGDVYILHEGAQFEYYPDRDNPWIKMWINVAGSLVRHLLQDYHLDQTVLVKGFHAPDYMQDIYDSARRNPSKQNRQIPILLHRMIAALSDFVGDWPEETSNARVMKDYIDTHLDTKILLNQLAKQVFLSRSQAISVFKKSYGCTPYDYVIKMKLQNAQVLLRSTYLPIREIADRLGFCSVSYFSDFFKSQTGLTPREYRKRDAGREP